LTFWHRKHTHVTPIPTASLDILVILYWQIWGSDGSGYQCCSLLDMKSCNFVDESQRTVGSASRTSYTLVMEAAVSSETLVPRHHLLKDRNSVHSQ
jgi:hypothetical protein